MLDRCWSQFRVMVSLLSKSQCTGLSILKEELIDYWPQFTVPDMGICLSHQKKTFSVCAFPLFVGFSRQSTWMELMTLLTWLSKNVVAVSYGFFLGDRSCIQSVPASNSFISFNLRPITYHSCYNKHCAAVAFVSFFFLLFDLQTISLPREIVKAIWSGFSAESCTSACGWCKLYSSICLFVVLFCIGYWNWKYDTDALSCQAAKALRCGWVNIRTNDKMLAVRSENQSVCLSAVWFAPLLHNPLRTFTYLVQN